MNINQIRSFVEKVLLPETEVIISQIYSDYIDNKDIGIQFKEDQTPATLADCKTEESLRKFIQDQFPTHGIHGEEFGEYQLTSDWIWIIDPLDGTKEFIAKKEGFFGSLIGLIHEGKVILGAISDPINKRSWVSGKVNKRNGKYSKLSDITLGCTAPKGMFGKGPNWDSMSSLISQVKSTQTHLNCLGFAGLIDGKLNAVIENQLKAHDIIPLIPVLLDAGMDVSDLEGNSYKEIQFDPINCFEKKYGVIASEHPELTQEILSFF